MALMMMVMVVAMVMMVVKSKMIPDYSTHRLEDLCSGKNGEKVVVQLQNNPVVLTLNTTKDLKCHLELELHSNHLGFSAFTELMQFDSTVGCSGDFYQFGRDFLVFTSHKGVKRCGKWESARRILREDGSLLRMEYGDVPRGKREYVEDVDKEMDLWLAVRAPASGEKAKQLRMVVTPFKKDCSKDDLYYKKCPSTKQCIRRELFCDGEVNCSGMEKDEQTEYCLQHLGGDMFISIPIIILIVVFSIIGLMFILSMIKVFAVHLRPKRSRAAARDMRPELEPSLSLCPPSSTSQLSGPARGMRALQAQLSTPPSTPPSAPQPDLLNLPINPPSYSEAVSTPQTPLYSGAPPKYSELPGSFT